MKKPSQEDFDLVVEAIRYEYKNNPIPLPRQLPTILNMAPSFSSKRNLKGVHILLDITKHSELKNITQDHIRSVIWQLECLEKILTDYSPKTLIPSDKPLTIPTFIPNDPLRYTMIIDDSFDNWYAAYQVKKNMKLEDMSLKTLEHIYKWVTKINEKFELSPSPKITLIDKDFKGDGLDFLDENGIVESYGLGYLGRDDEQEVKITLDVEKFIGFKPEIEKAYLNKSGKSVNKKPSKKEIELPSNAKWEDIAIEFKDGHNVDIKIKDKTIPSDYKEMGFEDKRNRKPDKQWELLIKLSESNGGIDWQSQPQSKSFNKRLTEQKLGFDEYEDDKDQNRGISYKKAPDSTKKTKQLLAKKLKVFFGIKEDPFFPYREEGSYRIKIALIPA